MTTFEVDVETVGANARWEHPSFGDLGAFLQAGAGMIGFGFENGSLGGSSATGPTATTVRARRGLTGADVAVLIGEFWDPYVEWSLGVRYPVDRPFSVRVVTRDEIHFCEADRSPGLVREFACGEDQAVRLHHLSVDAGVEFRF